MLQGLLTALVTPMDADGDVDYTSFTNLINYQIAHHAHGLVVLGSTGEAATLNLNEKLKIIDTAIHVTQKRVPIIVGVGQTSTSDAVAWAEELDNIDGVDYLLALTPSYVKATQAGLYAHFAAISKICKKKPIILYNVPSRTGCDLADSTTIKLAKEFKNIVGLKDATGDIARCNYLVKHKPARFKLFSGDDATSISFILSGGDGAISVTGNVVPQIMSQMIQAALDGHKSSAIKFNNSILELHSALFIESNPIPVKWALYKMKLINSPMLRLPLHTLDDSYHEVVTHALQSIIK
jgi:4-hydroxy-tetrahydrodipicolinate synthase